MAKRNQNKNTKEKSSVRVALKAHDKEMAQTSRKHAMFYVAIVIVFIAVCVAPLTAELFSPGLSQYKQHTNLKMDQAFLTVINELDTEVAVSWVSQRCYQCLYQQLGVVPAVTSPGQPSSQEFTVSTQHEITLQLNSTAVNLDLCTVPFHFGERGNYSLWVKNLNTSVVNCSIVTDADPVNSYIPILVAFLVFAGLGLMSALLRAIVGLDLVRGVLFRIGGTFETERLINSELGSPGRVVTPVTDNILPPPPSPSKRLRSLDTFRGISLVIMVFVNYGGGRYWFFRHESWNGLSVADLVFPWFVFIMGTSIALSINSLLRSGSRRTSLLKKVVWRSLQLFIIGVIIINPHYCLGPLSWDNLRIPGVLQRLSWSYLVVACLDLLVARGHVDILPTNAWWSSCIDVLLYWPAWLFVLLLEVLWLCLTFLLPVPGCPTGYLGPGGIGDMGMHANCTGGAAGLVDRWLLGENHIYQTPSTRVIYDTHVPYDPEGVLGSINSILMAFLGLQAGKIIIHYRDLHSSIISRFLIWGLFLGVISAVLTKCSTDQGFIPVNKNLWSLSYVTTLACFAFVLLVLVYYSVDVKNWWSGAPFFYPGMNSILVYVGHKVFEDYFPFRWRMVNTQSHAEHLTQNLVAVCCWVLISYVLYRKKIFWKI
ncbi:heparan-alpha-glucosaminide N-acetyltransferase isoform X2 [Dunckerocampus dactyliophorus]|uniref:heparan-alpha-glucosaminide N-acetyltransferase isoform X2 n=1 Tax=Dunckerocampus dactyliophorus TaxID=161453 RepID=UPI0024061828|nr:heparan-alpha-glucosaminide N-acetyltransferase isoform X2 [Dunckerocampus dactyliophorus]